MSDPQNRLDDFFDSAEELFDQAAQAGGGCIVRSVRVGGHVAHLKFAGPALATRLMRAIAHLEVNAADAPALTVLLWDTTSTDILLLPPPWELFPYFERGGIRGYRDGRYVLVYDRRTSVFSAVDTQRNVAIYWVRDAGWLPFYEIAAPLRHLLQGWLHSKGLFIIHASAVGLPDGGVLLAGKTGSGKSTTALLCLRSELCYAGDDYALTTAAPSPHVHSLYNSAKINASTLTWLPELRGQVSNPDRLSVEKAMIFLQPELSQKIVRSFPLRAILLPRVTDGEDTLVRPLPPQIAFRRIAPDTVFSLLGDARLLLQSFRRLVDQVPCYDFVLGTDLAQIPTAILKILQR